MKYLALILFAIPAIVVAQTIPNVITHPLIKRSFCITQSCCFEIAPEEVTQIGPGRSASRQAVRKSTPGQAKMASGIAARAI